jgi:hypothetical protein
LRTVETRLQHLYDKLGIRNRRALGDALVTVLNASTQIR